MRTVTEVNMTSENGLDYLRRDWTSFGTPWQAKKYGYVEVIRAGILVNPDNFIEACLSKGFKVTKAVMGGDCKACYLKVEDQKGTLILIQELVMQMGSTYIVLESSEDKIDYEAIWDQIENNGPGVKHIS
jgi:hypothetical protein